MGICLVTLLFSGCYVMRQGTSLLRYQMSARPVHRVLQDPGTSEQTREFLLQVEEILDFAMDELGLRESRNYRSYVEIDRNYLAAVVYAAESLSFVRHTWKFPIVGEVPYKGFFNPDHARREAEGLEAQGYDTWISAVTAFSTLGYFRDPLYSFMKHYSTYHIADLIIHELVHSTIWVKDQAGFNEALAVYIGNRGGELFAERTYGADSPEYQAIFDLRQDREQFNRDILELKKLLQEMYSMPIPDEQKLVRKQEIIDSFQKQFHATYEQRYLTQRYLGFAELDVNNAYISIFSLYHPGDDIYERIHMEAAGGDLSRMIELLKPLDGTRDDPYAFMKALLETYAAP